MKTLLDRKQFVLVREQEPVEIYTSLFYAQMRKKRLVKESIKIYELKDWLDKN